MSLTYIKSFIMVLQDYSPLAYSITVIDILASEVVYVFCFIILIQLWLTLLMLHDG